MVRPRDLRIKPASAEIAPNGAARQKRAHASPATSLSPAASSSTCPPSTISAFRVKLKARETARGCAVWLARRGAYPGGFIVRTAAGGATDEEIQTDIDFLGKTWNEIKAKSEERKAPSLLHLCPAALAKASELGLYARYLARDGSPACLCIRNDSR